MTCLYASVVDCLVPDAGKGIGATRQDRFIFTNHYKLYSFLIKAGKFDFRSFTIRPIALG